ncbi:hypothetical protein O6H91_05G023000 [Diphasiastrum complanatum]|uniref:Uncharacterized protein n=1 Tax=Diphasiastrum complanatum TaxID=34168 RepID=A0ACC2DLA4_DIPCM|nr:hypothetical protein O6H91_05G023000 [Diphasiastrum complanatum]
MAQNTAQGIESDGFSTRNTRQRSLEDDKEISCLHCGSVDTKFRYFNNKKRSQERYLCKTCRKTFTRGGKVRSKTTKVSSQPTQSDYNKSSIYGNFNIEASPLTIKGCDDYINFDIPGLVVVDSKKYLLNNFTKADAKLAEDWTRYFSDENSNASESALSNLHGIPTGCNETPAIGILINAYEDQSEMHIESLEAIEIRRVEDLDKDNIEDWQLTVEDLENLDFLLKDLWD